MTRVAAGTTVCVLGSESRPTAFSTVNAAWRRGLAGRGISLVDADGLPDVLVHHDYSTDFGTIELPDAARRIAVRPWDFGPYPPRWAEVVARDFDELWTFTTWGRECAIAGGVPPARVRVVPLGVDLRTFTPSGPAHELTTRAGFTFLFVGAATYRKGIDIALRAFLDAFDNDDDVQLIVKDHTRDVFYEALSFRDEITQAADRAGAPDIVYVDRYMPTRELASLYRGSDALVLPSRAEGWALPVLEALACGTPAVVPSFGAFLDYCTDVAAFLVPTRRIKLPVVRELAFNTLGFRERVEAVDFCETSVASLGHAMRSAFGEHASARTRRSAAARELASGYGWSRSVDTIVAAIVDLVSRSGDGRAAVHEVPELPVDAREVELGL